MWMAKSPRLITLLGLLLAVVACGGRGQASREVLPATYTPAILPSLMSVTAVPEPSPTSSPTLTPVPTASQTPSPQISDTAPVVTPSSTSTPSATPIIINGVNLEQVLNLPAETRRHIVEIYNQGQRLGRDPGSFSKLGASVIDTFHFLGRFDQGPYDLGPYTYLQPAVDQFSGSFERESVATRRGLTAQATFDPMWATAEDCLANESVLDCEIRLHNPSILLIVLGTNDLYPENEFETNLKAIVETTLDLGVIPVLATKADRFEGEDNRNNLAIRRVADEYQVPLWDFDLLAATLPDRGMSGDDVHLTMYDPYDYTRALAFKTGYGLYNLSALMMLYEIWQEFPTS